MNNSNQLQVSTTGEIVNLSPEWWGLPMIVVDRRCEKDKWNNEVTKFVTPGYTYRMVHFTEPYRSKQRAIIYGGRGIFVRSNSFSSENDCVAEWVECGPFRVTYGDGDFLGIDPAQGDYWAGVDWSDTPNVWDMIREHKLVHPGWKNLEDDLRKTRIQVEEALIHAIPFNTIRSILLSVVNRYDLWQTKN